MPLPILLHIRPNIKCVIACLPSLIGISFWFPLKSHFELLLLGALTSFCPLLAVLTNDRHHQPGRFSRSVLPITMLSCIAAIIFVGQSATGASIIATNRPTSIHVSRRGDLIFLVRGMRSGKTITAVRRDSGSVVWSSLPLGEISAIVELPDVKRVVIGTMEGTLDIIDISTGAVVMHYAASGSILSLGCAATPTGCVLVRGLATWNVDVVSCAEPIQRIAMFPIETFY